MPLRSRAEAVGCMSFQVEGSDDAVSIFRSSLAHLKRALRLKEDRNDQRWRVARPIRSPSFTMKHAVVIDRPRWRKRRQGIGYATEKQIMNMV